MPRGQSCTPWSETGPFSGKKTHGANKRLAESLKSVLFRSSFQGRQEGLAWPGIVVESVSDVRAASSVG